MWPVELGGTGADTAAGALAALGLPYEVGTWTPEKIGGNYSGEISSYSDCNYLRIGRLLYASCKLFLSAAQSTDCYMQIRGLPFYINPVAMGWTVISNTAYSGQGNAIYTTGNLYFTDGVPVAGATIYYGMVGIMRG